MRYKVESYKGVRYISTGIHSSKGVIFKLEDYENLDFYEWPIEVQEKLFRVAIKYKERLQMYLIQKNIWYTFTPEGNIVNWINKHRFHKYRVEPFNIKNVNNIKYKDLPYRIKNIFMNAHLYGDLQYNIYGKWHEMSDDIITLEDDVIYGIKVISTILEDRINRYLNNDIELNDMDILCIAKKAILEDVTFNTMCLNLIKRNENGK